MPTPALRRAPAAVLLVLATFPACGGGRVQAESPNSSLSPYSPEAAVLFDDVLAPAVFGFDSEGRDPAKDPRVRERTRQAEFVVGARVESVSRVGGVEHHSAYEITLAPTLPALVGSAPESIVLSVPASSPSYTWVDGAGAGWVGSRLLVFGRRYRDGSGAVLHFRGEADSPALRAVVGRDAGLRVLR